MTTIGKKRRYYRKYSYYWNKRYKWVYGPYGHANYKLDLLCTMGYIQQNPGVIAYPALKDIHGNSIGAGNQYDSVIDLLGRTPKWTYIKEIYQAYKVRGVLVTVIKHGEVPNADLRESNVMILSFTNSSASGLPANIDEINELPQKIVMTPTQNYYRMYYKFTNSWSDINSSNQDPIPYLIWTGIPQNPAGTLYNINFKFYVSLRSRQI